MWDHVLFGLGGSGTGRNVDSPSEQQRIFLPVEAVFKGMGYYSWPVKPLQIAMTSWLGLVLQGTNKGGFVPRVPQRALRVLGGDLEGGRVKGVRSHIWLLYLT